MDFLMLPFKIATRIHPLLGIPFVIVYLSFLVSLVLAPIDFIAEALIKSVGKK